MFCVPEPIQGPLWPLRKSPTEGAAETAAVACMGLRDRRGASRHLVFEGLHARLLAVAMREAATASRDRRALRARPMTDGNWCGWQVRLQASFQIRIWPSGPVALVKIEGRSV